LCFEKSGHVLVCAQLRVLMEMPVDCYDNA
jgi:hypothetical protein